MIAIDTETHPIAPGLLAPPAVCISFAAPDGSGVDAACPQSFARVRGALASDVVVGHNVAFDLAVLVAADPYLGPLVWRALAEGRVGDTMIRAKLRDLARSGLGPRESYSLAALASRYLGVDRRAEKKAADSWRLRYAELDGTPVEEWPPEARVYPVRDAENTRDLWLRLGPESPTEEESRQVAAAYALHLAAVWGVRTDPARVKEFRAAQTIDYERATETLRAIGWVRADGTTDTSRVAETVVACLGDAAPKTATGKTQIDEEAILRAALAAPTDGAADALAAYSRRAKAQKLLTTYLPVLEAGAAGPICSRPEVLVESGRTAWASPNLQNLPRASGVRECFAARPGRVFVGADYDSAELRGLAQVCLDLFGASEMAEALRRGESLHLELAATMLGISVAAARRRYQAGDADVVRARQSAKAANFGFPGGMGVARFLESQREIVASLGLVGDAAAKWGEDLRRAWFARWPEMTPYFRHAADLARSGSVRQHRSGRVRAVSSFTQAANTLFQGLVADGAKAALVRVSRACYDDDPRSGLYGSRVVFFVHDEILVEAPAEKCHEAGEALVAEMVAGMKQFLPDVPVVAEAAAFRWWSKGTKPRHVDGRLVPSDDAP